MMGTDSKVRTISKAMISNGPLHMDVPMFGEQQKLTYSSRV